MKQRLETIKDLRLLAKRADKLQQKKGCEEMVINGYELIGGLAFVGSGIVTVATAGAALPVIAADLTFIGTYFSLLSKACSIFFTCNNVITNPDADLMESIRTLLEKDEKAIQELQALKQENVHFLWNWFGHGKTLYSVYKFCYAYKDFVIMITREAAPKACAAVGKDWLINPLKETWGQIKGCFTVITGSYSILQSSYDCKRGYEKKVSKSSLGDELRRLADELEKNMCMFTR